MVARSISLPIARSISRAINNLAGGFSPLSLFAAGEQGAWYDPSDLSTLFQDTAGTIPVTAAGQPVGLMRDKSGRGNHATQATATSRPILQTANGLWYLAFDGVDDGMATASINFSATDKMTGWLGALKTSDTVSQIIAELTVVADNTNGGFMMGNGTALGDFSRRSWSAATRGVTIGLLGDTSIFASPDKRVMSVSANNAATPASSQIVMRLNGVPQTLALNTAGTSAGNYANTPFYIGRRAGTSNAFAGNLYGLIVRGAASDAATIAQTEAWMNSKTGAY